MLVFQNHNQLANQMFIYACARSLATRMGLVYCLDNLGDLPEYFELTKEDRNLNAIKYQLFRIENKIPGRRYKINHWQDYRFDYSDQMTGEKGTRNWYYGYFQGEKYFFGNDAEMRRLFALRPKHIAAFNQVWGEIPKGKKICTIHCRRKDFKTFGPDFLNGPDLTLPFSYYHQIIGEFESKEYQFIVISDDIEEVKKEFSYIPEVYFSENESIIDFQILQHSNVCILANSTFGWWGAYLNDLEDKKVFVPDYFLGFKVKKEFPPNIIPQNWIRKEVELP